MGRDLGERVFVLEQPSGKLERFFFSFLDILEVGGGTCHLLDPFDAYVLFFFFFSLFARTNTYCNPAKGTI